MDLKEEIRALLKSIPEDSFRGRKVGTPWGMMHEVNKDFVGKKIASLQKEYPGFNFRLIQCHDKTHTYSAISIDFPDPREWGEMSRHGSWDNEGYYTKFKDENNE